MAQRVSDSWDIQRPAMFGRMRTSTGRVELPSISLGTDLLDLRGTRDWGLLHPRAPESE